MLNLDPKTPIWQISIEDFVEINKKIFAAEIEELKMSISKQKPKNVEYGLKGLAKVIGTAKSTASRLKKDGVFDGAITQRGKIIIIDADKALKLFNDNKTNKGKKNDE